MHSTEVFHEQKEHASAHGIICKELEHDLSALMKKKDKELLTSLRKASRAGQQKGVTCLEEHSPHYWKWWMKHDRGKSAGKYSAKSLLPPVPNPVELPLQYVMEKWSLLITLADNYENGGDGFDAERTGMCLVRLILVEIIEFLPSIWLDPKPSKNGPQNF